MSQQKTQDLPPPMVSLAFANRVIPTSYDLSFEITPVKANYTGIVLMGLTENEKFTDSKAEDLKFEITLNSVELIATDAYLHQGSTVSQLSMKSDRKTETIKLHSDTLTFKEVLAEENLKLRVHFLGVVRPAMAVKDFTRGVFKTRYKDPKTGKPGLDIISTHCQPSFARTIFPCIDDILIKVPFKLAINTDKAYTSVSNTPIESSENLDDGRKLVVFERTPLMTTSVFGFVVGDFEFVEEIIPLKDNLEFPIRVYTQIGESKRAQLALKTATEVLPIIESKFGVSYPLPKLDFVALPFLSDGGVENWSIIQILNDHILTPDVDDPARVLTITNMIKNVLVHEMVHMYVGDMITFESYDYTWLNEAFATFMSNAVLNELDETRQVWLDQTNNDLFNMKRYQGLESMKPIFAKNVAADKIQSTFSKHSYEKGIFVVRMLGNLFNDLPNDNFDNFFKIIGDFVETNKFGLFKPVDLWNFLKDHELNKFKYDIPTIMNSWIRIAGYPILDVKQQDGDKLIIEQHRFMYNPKASIEDTPYQVPLFVKFTDSEIVVGKQLLTDRKIELDAKDVLIVNANNTAIATVKYPLPMYKNIAANFEKLNDIEQCQILLDISTILSESYQSDDVILGLIEIVESISKSSKPINPTAMNIALTLTNNLSKSILTVSYFKDKPMYEGFSKWLDNLTTTLIDQFTWEGADFTQMPNTELSVRSSVLSLCYSNEKSQAICKQLYKALTNGPNYSIPKILLNAILSNTLYKANVKDYKEIMALIKNPGQVEANVSDVNTEADIKKAALTSLGSTSTSELRQKTLNYALSNMNNSDTELVLLGFKFQPDSYELLWAWFNSNFNNFFTKMMGAGSSETFINFFKSIVQLVFECCLCSQELTDKLEKFLIAKKVEILDSEYGKIRQLFGDRLKLNEANEAIKKTFKVAEL